MRFLALTATALYLFPTVYLPHYESNQVPRTVVVSERAEFTSRQVNSVQRRLERLMRYKVRDGDLRTPRR